MAKVKITPPVGSPLAGYSNRTALSTGVHDELFARALVLDNGTTRAALVSCDLIGVLGETTDAVRNSGINVEIPGENMMVCAYHTHSGPTPDLGYGEMEKYMEFLSNRISSAVLEASLSIDEGRFKFASAKAEGLTINRRDPVNGPIDPELITLCWESGAAPRGYLVNYSCHAVVLGPDNTMISADYPGYLMSRMEGSGATCLFTNGACGDINPLTDSLRKRMERGEDIYDRRGGTFQEAEVLGMSLSKLALESLLASESLGDDRLVVATQTFDAPFHSLVPIEVLDARIEELQAMLPAMQDGSSPPDELYRTGLELEFAKRARESMRRGGPRVEIQGILIGDVVLVGIPGELFVEIGLEIKKMAGTLGLKCVIIELANDYLSYLPTSSSFQDGGYETEIARSLGYGPELQELLLGSVGKTLEKLASD
jgi:hypothetical protein